MIQSASGADISDGRAIIPISWRNDVDDAALPKFNYEPLPKFVGNPVQNRVFFRMFCECVDECSAQKGCVCVGMSSVSLSKPGYVQNAHLLSENPFDSLFFECSSLCSCAGTCANRLAPSDGTQQNYLQIFKTLKAGFGCKTLKPIRKGSFVCFLGGEVFPSGNATNKTDKSKQIEDAEKVCFTFSDRMRQLAFFVRFDTVANESRFFNSACCPNLRLVHLFRDWLTPNRPFVAFIAISEIGAGEELSHYYGDHWFFAKLHARPKFVCHCASPFCVWPPKANRRDDFFSRPKDLQLKANKVRTELRKQQEQKKGQNDTEMKREEGTEEKNAKRRRGGGGDLQKEHHCSTKQFT